MSTRGKTLALALVAAVVLASGAYALGTQAGGGEATARDNGPATNASFEIGGPGGPPGPPGGPGGPGFRAHLRGPGPAFFGLDRLADRLGVKQSDLKQALRELRTEAPKELHDDFTKQLAQELGIDEGKLEDALEKVRAKQEQAMKQHHDELAQKLADKLGISVDKVKEALPEPRIMERRHP